MFRSIFTKSHKNITTISRKVVILFIQKSRSKKLVEFKTVKNYSHKQHSLIDASKFTVPDAYQSADYYY
jgi:hypothetical protein